MKIVYHGLLVLAAVALATAVSQSFGRFTYAVLLTDIRDELGVSNTLAGTFGSANLVAYLLGSLLVSLFIGRVGLTTLAISSVGLVTLGLGTLAWSPNGTWVAIGLVVTGFAAAGVWITAPALATAALGNTRRGTAIGVAISGVGLGMVVASALDTWLPWRHVYLAQAAIGGVAALLLFGFRNKHLRESSRGAGMRVIRLIPGWRSLLLSYGAFGLSMSIVVTFLVALLEDDAGLGAARASFAFSLLGIGSVFGGPLAGVVADRLGRRTALIGAFLTMASATFVIAAGHEVSASVAAFVFGLAFTGVPVAVTVVVSDHARGAAFGSAYGVATIVFGIGLAIGPQLGGAIADVAGSFRPAFMFAVACTLVGMAAGGWVSRTGRGKP